MTPFLTAAPAVEGGPFDPCISRWGLEVLLNGELMETARWLQVEMRCITDRISSMLENNNNTGKR